ncbi:MAG: hypothetical protein AABY14_02260 [Nanoarchaeota archaeon]
MNEKERYIEIERRVAESFIGPDTFYYYAKNGYTHYLGMRHSDFRVYLANIQKVYNEINDSDIEILMKGTRFEDEQISAIEKAIGKEIKINWKP